MNQGRAKPSPGPPIAAARPLAGRFPAIASPCQPRRRERGAIEPGEGQALLPNPGLPLGGRFPTETSPCQAAAGEREKVNRGRAWPSPGPPDCRGAAAFQSLSNRYLSLPADAAGEGEKLNRGRAKPSPELPMAAARPLPDGHFPPVRRRERGEELGGGGPSPSPNPHLPVPGDGFSFRGKGEPSPCPRVGRDSPGRPTVPGRGCGAGGAAGRRLSPGLANCAGVPSRGVPVPGRSPSPRCGRGVGGAVRGRGAPDGSAPRSARGGGCRRRRG